MKKTIFILLTLACSMTGLKAQQAFAANTGDPEMDGILSDVDTKAKKDMNAFTNDVFIKYHVPKDKITEAVKVMNPGDVYMSAQVASATNKPFDVVTKSFQENKGKGWGEIAKEMGIKPGSPEFHEMKKSMKNNGNSEGKANGNGKGGKNKGNGQSNNGGNENSSNDKGKGPKNKGNGNSNENSGSGNGNVGKNKGNGSSNNSNSTENNNTVNGGKNKGNGSTSNGNSTENNNNVNGGKSKGNGSTSNGNNTENGSGKPKDKINK